MSITGKFFGLVLIAAGLLAACSGLPTGTPVPLPPQGSNPFAPQPGDGGMMQSKVEIVPAGVVAIESMPPQFSVALAYRLPTPCNDLRVKIDPPDQSNRILLEIYSVAPKDKPCNMMELATPQQANISLGSFSGGSYTVWVNGVQVGSFNS
jgi:hypothetical protein